MGLDMFLDGSRYLSSYSTRDKPISENVIKNFPELVVIGINRIKKVTIEIGYWRKANAIHNWFVQNIQNGNDDCNNYYVSRESLEKLKEICQQVLNEPDRAEELFPPVDGFFFGSTEIDEGYYQDLTDTIEIIDKALQLDHTWGITYHSSW